MKKKDIIKSILLEFHNSSLPSYIKRDAVIPVNSGKIISLVGARRSGKTYLMYQLIDNLVTADNSRTNIVYLNFEDERIDFAKEDLDLILQSYRELYPDTENSSLYFFFDEVQNAEGWEKFIRRIHDTISKNIFITGSNSKMLGDEIATSLRGRTLKYEVHPLSFKEFLLFNDIAIALPHDIHEPKKKARILNLFREYLLWGGFPEIVFLPKELKTRTLQEYYDVMIYRDLIERYSIKDHFVLKYFIKRAAESVTKPLSINKIFNELKSHGFKTGKNTLYDFLEYLDNAIIVSRLKKFRKSIAASELAEKKVYFIDNGILRAIRIFREEDYGILLENLMYRELKKHSRSMFFFKENNECDFILDEGIPVQSCYDLSDPAVKKRELEGISAACRQLHAAKGYIITFDDEESFEMDNCAIEAVPAYRWLLEER